MGGGMKYKAWFRCSAGCNERYELTEIVYRCRQCGELLEVAHDVDKLRQRKPVSWKRLFDRRYMRTNWPYGSSVWGKKELVCPNVQKDRKSTRLNSSHSSISYAVFCF